MSGIEHLQRIVAAFGGQAALGRAIGASQGTVWGWLKSGFVPTRRVPQIIAAAARLDPPVTLTPADFFPAGAGAQQPANPAEAA